MASRGTDVKTQPQSQPEEGDPPAPHRLKKAFGKFPTGVTVVTCRTPDGTPHGATVNAFTAVSMDPPLAQVTLVSGNKISGYLKDIPFAINVMATDQLQTCLHFAGKPMKEGPKWRSDDGLPVLTGTAATIECKPWAIYDGGDHDIVIGEITEVEVNDVDPLCFISGKFHEVGRLHGGTPWEGSADGMAFGWLEASDVISFG